MKTHLITKDGLNKINEEYKKLQKDRVYWVKEKESAAAMGDRSENAEYQYAKESIRTVEKRLFYLKDIIESARPASVENRRKDRIVFGSYVTLLKDDNTELKIRIVGTNELSLHEEEGVTFISNISPMGKTLIGKEIGDDIFVANNEYEIIEIE